MVQQSIPRIMSRPTLPALIWITAVETPLLRPAVRSFGFADDEADFEQALADYRAAARPAITAPQGVPEDFERLYGWFLA